MICCLGVANVANKSSYNEEVKEERSKIYLIMLMSFTLLLWLLWKRLNQVEKHASVSMALLDASMRENRSLEYDYFNIVKWP